jgi:hypothetical protein
MAEIDGDWFSPCSGDIVALSMSRPCGTDFGTSSGADCSSSSAEERARVNWNKTIKPTKSDYVVFKEG